MLAGSAVPASGQSGTDDSRALNIGLAHARGEFVARMDVHSRYPDDYLAQGIKRLRRGDVQAVSGPVLPVGSGVWSRRIACALLTRLGSGGADFRDLQHERIVLSGFTGVWRAETVRGLGGWDEGWPVNQDVELASRLRVAGGRAVSGPLDGGRLPAAEQPSRARAPVRALRPLSRQVGGPPSRVAAPCAPGLSRLVLTAVAAVAPTPLQVPACALLGAYACGVAVTSARAPLAAVDRLALPAVFLTMHAAWGLGHISGWARYGWQR